jgi:hypothetical protein
MHNTPFCVGCEAAQMATLPSLIYAHKVGGLNEKRCKTQKKTYPKRLHLYSNPTKAQQMAYRYLGKTAKLYPANNPQKKYKIYDKIHNTWVNFGQLGYEDYTKHQDKRRRKNYLTRTKYIKGNWRKNRYSANNLSRNILW